LNELDRVAAEAAGEAVGQALFGVDGHGCTALAVNGATHLLVAPSALVEVYAVVGEDRLQR
jgi:hypothetical protein